MVSIKPGTRHRGLTPIPATAGYHRPPHKANRGYGLWIARQLADVVTTHTDRDGQRSLSMFPSPPAVAAASDRASSTSLLSRRPRRYDAVHGTDSRWSGTRPRQRSAVGRFSAQVP
jgi:hypothetical protein